MKRYVLIIFSILVCVSVKSQDDNLKSLFEKDTICIVVTDSGLGGLSVVADIERKMNQSGQFAKINLIFANALFDKNGGYNSLVNREEKISKFNTVLRGLSKKYNPDLILIACNTLSVIYKETAFAKSAKFPIIGIVDIGVQEIQNALKSDDNSKVIIFGTETTIEEDKHRSQLISAGISSQRIIPQACSQLQQYIEHNPMGDDTEMLIMSYIDEALVKADLKNEAIYVSLNCSHFGYSHDLWISGFEFAGIKPKSIINPNIKMSEILLNEEFKHKYKKTDINIKVVSKVIIHPDNIKSISDVLEKKSSACSLALREYKVVNDLF